MCEKLAKKMLETEPTVAHGMAAVEATVEDAEHLVVVVVDVVDVVVVVERGGGGGVATALTQRRRRRGKSDGG